MLRIRSQAGAYSVSISPETEQEGLFGRAPGRFGVAIPWKASRRRD